MLKILGMLTLLLLSLTPITLFVILPRPCKVLRHITIMRLSLVLVALTCSTAQAFAPSSVVLSPSTTRPAHATRSVFDKAPSDLFASSEDDCEVDANNSSNMLKGASKLALTTASVWAATASTSLAAGPDWGIFEGRTLSLVHPAMMAGLLMYSLYTAFLGFQWRRQRTMGDEISALKKSLPVSDVPGALATAKEAGDAAEISKLESAMSTVKEIDALTKERKDLAAAGPRDQHYAQGALLAFLGTAFAIEGPLNTYARAGKLFPGPHLYGGAGLVVLWALAASCVPAMQKGNDTARTIHIGANLGGLGLFAWQVTSGIPIMLKVIEFTKWP